MNYYEILEVSATARPEVIRAAYKSLMQQFHPDRNLNNPEAAKRAILISQAYEVLSDADKRAAYDHTLKQHAMRVKQIQFAERHNASNHADEQPRVMFWALIIVAILLAWVALMWSMKFFVNKPKTEATIASTRQPTVAAPAENVSFSNFASNAQVNEKTVKIKTIPNYLIDVGVNLNETGNPHELHIPMLDLLVGTYEQEAFLQNMEKNKSSIKKKILNKLADCKYEMLISENGEAYLKTIILDAIGEATETDRLDTHPAATKGAPQQGVIDVLMPKFFSLK